MNRLQVYALPVLSGILLALAFPTPDIHAVAWFGLVPLLYSLSGKGPSEGFREGFAAGLVFYLASIWWVINTMYHYGGLPVSVSIGLLVALAAYLALYFGAFGLAFCLVRRRLGSAAALLSAPAVWVSLELLRNYMISGFPWNLLGYSQHASLPVIQFADITGVYGVSALVVLVNAGITQLLLFIKNRRGAIYCVRNGRDESRPYNGKERATLFLSLAVPALAVAAMASAFVYGSYRLDHMPKPSGSLKAALVQGNIEQFHKWDPAFQGEVFDTYKRLTAQAAKDRPGIIIWPETATPFYFQDKEMNPELLQEAKASGTYLLTGSPTLLDDCGRYMEYNSAYLLTPEGTEAGRYDKMHLVPFGEYVPLKKLLPFVSRMVTSIGDFGHGTQYRVLDTGHGAFGTAICFEVIFPELVRHLALNGADFLVTITNDAWFGDSAAPYQHFDMAVFRAVENRRALLRVANTGITGIILPSGQVASRTGLFREAVLTGAIPLVREKTFYTLHGDVFAYACAVVSIIILMICFFPFRHPRENGGPVALSE